ARNQHNAQFHRGRPPGELRSEPDRCLSPCRPLRRPDFQRSEARRHAGRAGDQDRSRHQPRNCEGARHRNPRQSASACRRGDRMSSRREFISLLGGAAAWPLAARAQQRNVPVIGFLDSKSARDSRQIVAAFHRGLNEAAFIEGQNVAIEYRWAENHYDRLPMLVADLVQRKVALIAAPLPPTSPRPLQPRRRPRPSRLSSIPTNPVAVGLVASFNRPGGNVTGITSLNTEVASKRLELLREVVPKASTIGLLVNQANPQLAHTSSNDEIDEAFAALARQGIGALVVTPDP